MMVGHDDGDALLLECRDFVDRIDSVVNGDDHPDIGMVAEHTVDGTGAHSVSLAQPVRQKRRNFFAERTQNARQNGRCADAVAIVIAENDDFSVRRQQDFRRRLHAIESLRRRQRRNRRIEITLQRFRTFNPARGKNLAQYTRQTGNGVDTQSSTSRHQPCLSSRTPYWMP